MTSKTELVELLRTALNDKVDSLDKAISSATASRNSDTKSSAGDKFETSREMAQQEIDRYEGQLAQIKRQLSDLKQLDLSDSMDKVKAGALISTADGLYFLSMPFGKLDTDAGAVYCISTAAPIARAMLGKAVGESFYWQGKQTEVLEIS